MAGKAPGPQCDRACNGLKLQEISRISPVTAAPICQRPDIGSDSRKTTSSVACVTLWLVPHGCAGDRALRQHCSRVWERPRGPRYGIKLGRRGGMAIRGKGEREARDWVWKSWVWLSKRLPQGSKKWLSCVRNRAASTDHQQFQHSQEMKDDKGWCGDGWCGQSGDVEPGGPRALQRVQRGGWAAQTQPLHPQRN